MTGRERRRMDCVFIVAGKAVDKGRIGTYCWISGGWWRIGKKHRYQNHVLADIERGFLSGLQKPPLRMRDITTCAFDGGYTFSKSCLARMKTGYRLLIHQNCKTPSANSDTLPNP